MNDAIKINPKDNVAVALRSIEQGETILGVVANNPIPRGHKIALEEIPVNAHVIKYGQPIGHAIQIIHPGDHVHTHNVKTNLSDNLTYHYLPETSDQETLPVQKEIKAFLRKNGEIGIRNELWVIPTVGCINRVALAIADKAKAELDLSHIDGIQVFSHPFGCSQLGDDLETTRKTLQRMALHPNAGGVLVVGLGCENNQIGEFKKTLGNYDSERIQFLICQESDDELRDGVALIKEMVLKMNHDQRTLQPISKLKIGLKCGGSDGLSGITANPLVGLFSDVIVSAGGSTVLTEVPEMFGAETLLMNRAEDPKTFEKIVSLINDFKDYYRRHDQVIYENPSPGNKAGGITTLEDKSLGCTQKAGHATVVGVLKPNDPIVESGLHLLQGPGNDLISSTLLGTSGCQLILFTTGRGTPFGAFVPTLKISSNSELFLRKPDWIDFNAGQIADGKSYHEVLVQLVEEAFHFIEGKKTKNEINGYREMAIFKTGVTL